MFSPAVPAFAEFAADYPFPASTSSAGVMGFGDRIALPPSQDGGETIVQALLVGCDADLRRQLHNRLAKSQWCLSEAASGAEALERLAHVATDIVLVAPSLPDLDATEFQQLVLLQFQGVQVFSLEDVLAPASTTAARASSMLLDEPRTREGPFGPSSRVASPRLRERAQDWQGIIGSSPAMQSVFRTASLIAHRDTTVLIQGESGTGKDLLARAIHESSPRAKQPFVVINCAAIPEALLEAELFGYTKGSFTGASQSRLGRVHAAHGGTLFLDEIGDMPLALQSKILRFLEQGEVQRIGSADSLKVDCRILAATNANLQEQVKAKQFREDLYYRLAVMPIAVPPLRERMSDLPALCATFLKRFCLGTELHHDAFDLLNCHPWPGNVRELRNVLERASVFAEGRREILPEDILL